MGLRHLHKLTVTNSKSGKALVAIKSPDAKELSEGINRVGLSICSSVIYESSDGPFIDAEMSIKQAESLADRILEACAASRMSARLIGYKGLK